MKNELKTSAYLEIISNTDANFLNLHIVMTPEVKQFSESQARGIFLYCGSVQSKIIEDAKMW